MINYIEKYHSHLYYILTLCCFGLYLFQRIPGLSLKIGNAVPLLLLPAITVIACFLREWTGFFAGLLCGVALDTTLNGSACFNTLVLLLLGTATGLVFRFFMNRNIKAVLIIGFLNSAVYFLLKWLFLDLLSGDASAVRLLLHYQLPSAVYTALFTLPFFYFVKWLSGKYLLAQH